MGSSRCKGEKYISVRIYNDSGKIYIISHLDAKNIAKTSEQNYLGKVKECNDFIKQLELDLVYTNYSIFNTRRIFIIKAWLIMRLRTLLSLLMPFQGYIRNSDLILRATMKYLKIHKL